MKAAQIPKPNAAFEIVERDVPEPMLGVSTEPIEASPLLLISARRSISGWPSGTATDSEDTLRFSVMSDVRPAVETFPLTKAAEAYQHMMSGKARFRVVLTP